MSADVIDRFDGEHRFLSNFFVHELRWNGVTWPNAEHAFQAAKTLDPQEAATVHAAPTPGKAKKLGRRVTLRSDWDSVKLPIMKSILEAKFAVPELRERLLATGHAELIEGNTWGDQFWGVCDDIGHNWLGKLLMMLRNELRWEP
jgi:ribA/ribD-fused uncharacterized protein